MTAMTDLTAKLTALLGTLGWRSDMENMPKGRPLIGLIPLEATGRQPAFVGEAFDMEPSTLVDKWTGRWMTVTHWKPLDTPDTPDPTAALLREAIDALEAAEAERLAAWQDALDAAWRTVDALGGTYDKTDPGECAYAAALNDACLAVEKLGGMDPVCRDAERRV